MTLREQFDLELKNYVNCEDLVNFAKFNQGEEYLRITTVLLYDLFVELESQGATEYVVPEYMVQTLVDLRSNESSIST